MNFKFGDVVKNKTGPELETWKVIDFDIATNCLYLIPIKVSLSYISKIYSKPHYSGSVYPFNAWGFTKVKPNCGNKPEWL